MACLSVIYVVEKITMLYSIYRYLVDGKYSYKNSIDKISETILMLNISTN